MIIPIYLNLETKSIKSSPIQILQNSTGISIKFLPYIITQNTRYVSTINEEEVYPPYPEEILNKPNFDFIQLTFIRPDNTKYIDSTNTDEYQIPQTVLTVDGTLTLILDIFYKGELQAQAKLNIIQIIPNPESPEYITTKDEFPILQNLIQEVNRIKGELQTNWYSREEVDSIINILKVNNNLK